MFHHLKVDYWSDGLMDSLRKRFKRLIYQNYIICDNFQTIEICFRSQ